MEVSISHLSDSVVVTGEVGGFHCDRGRWVGSVVVTGGGGWVHPNATNSMTVFGPGLALVAAGWVVLYLLC